MKRNNKYIVLYPLALFLLTYTAPCEAWNQLVINGENANYINWGINADPSGTYDITSGGNYTTYARNTQTGGPPVSRYNEPINILNGGIWRPLDAKSAIYASALTMHSGSMIDLAYKYSAANGYTQENGYDPWSAATSSSFNTERDLSLDNGKFEGNIAFRLNMGTAVFDMYHRMGGNDLIDLDAPQIINSAEYPTVNVTLHYIIGNHFGEGMVGSNCYYPWDHQTAAMLKNRIPGIFSIGNSDTATMDKFNVSGSGEYHLDGAINKYLLQTQVQQDETNPQVDYTTHRVWSLVWTARRQNYLSQGAYSAANAALASRNMWRIEDDVLWKHGDDIRFADRTGSKSPEGFYVNNWHGKYNFGGIQGSSFNQSYSGLQVGYDKLRRRKLFNGRVHTGVFVSKLNSGADFSAQNAGGADYNSGSGNVSSLGFGAYMLWEGQKGHYLDTMLRWSKVDNNYAYTDSYDNTYTKDFISKSYGIGARYGRYITRNNGWFMEPQIGLSYGVTRAYNFRTANDLEYMQDKTGMLTGHAGITLGKKYGQGSHSGEAYLKLAANHDFNSNDAMFYAMQPESIKLEIGADPVLASQKINNLEGRDTWYDVSLGSNFKMGNSHDGWVGVTKSFGGKVNTDWQVNGGITWHWGGPPSRKKQGTVPAAFTAPVKTTGATAESVKPAQTGSRKDATAENTIAGTTANSKVNTAGSKQTAGSVSKISPPAAAADVVQPVKGTAPAAVTAKTAGQAVTNNRPVDETVSAGKNASEFALTPTVVESGRPDWEKKLSPGTVSVIDVPKYKGEQKTLADLLQTVPGVYIDRMSGGGTGHYSTVRVRGSSASEVSIYIDGVLVNTGSESAVNLENINIDNVERIEVYRGYIPARFAGAAMGGAINIVTKKPTKTGGKISYGLRSFGGQKFNLETTAPVGDGSLLLALNKEQAEGDFKYNLFPNTYGFDRPTGIPSKRWRQNNGYSDKNMLAKWQDKNWFVKVAYTDNSTHKPESINPRWPLVDSPEEKRQYGIIWSSTKAFLDGVIDTRKTELSFGRRQQAGNLEWGWKLGMIHQNKKSLYCRGVPNGLMFGTNTFKNDIYNASVDGTWKMGNHLLEFLLSGSRETMNVKFDTDNEFSSGYAKDLYKDWFLPKYNMSNYYLQLQDTMKLDDSGSLTFTPLVRSQRASIGIPVREGKGWLNSYNLALKKQFDKHFTAWATYGTYYRMPNWYEVFGDGLYQVSRWFEFNSIAAWGPEVFAEHGQNWDVSLNWKGRLLGADDDTTLTYFHRNSENTMTLMFNPIWGDTWYANYGAGEVHGVEFNNKLHWHRYDLLLAATWQNSLVKQGYTPRANMSYTTWQGQPLSWTPAWTVNARLDYRFPGDKLSIFGEYYWVDKLSWFNNAGEATYYTPLGLLNVGIKYKVNKQLKLITGINDVGNRGPEQRQRYNWWKAGPGTTPEADSTVPYPQQGRTYYMTLEYSF
ncbi:TonB-dependent receptor domain-containing protein [Pectinatus sottacetonis]|uniref:TonB-dependent receptor domain-containing protein n=1 Tax=Pectinatus sottacetonis TaxID=1002795 RepID=UPI0018C4D65C|nr:TonB-dependent receptor [Pectinatus sottacetonis]